MGRAKYRKTPSKDTFAILVENALSGRSTKSVLCGKHYQSALDELVYGTIKAVDEDAEAGVAWCLLDLDGYQWGQYYDLKDTNGDTVTHYQWCPLSDLEFMGT